MKATCAMRTRVKCKEITKLELFDTKELAEMIYEALPGYFKAFESKGAEGIDSRVVDPIEMVNHNNWSELYDSIPPDTNEFNYKLLVLARHGQGFHNAAIIRYGQKEWDRHWSLLEGDEYGSWLDSRLTPLGKEQVQATGERALLPIIDEMHLLPHVFFSSPMRRCLETFVGSWTPVLNRHKVLAPKDIIPVKIIEDLRETLGEHTCDKRVTYTEVTEEYQDCKTTTGHTVHWDFEPDYPENDEMWLPDHRETEEEMGKRIHAGLIKMFQQVDSSQRILSLTCHSGVIRTTLRNLNHPPVNFLNTGKIVCAVVKIDVSELKKTHGSSSMCHIN